MNFAEKDKQYIWHPFTQMKLAAPPLHIQKAEGCYLHTQEGKKYLDAISSWWVNIHGHAHPHIAKCIARQAQELEHVIFAGFTHTPAITLAEKLVNILPGNFSKIFYSDNGSTSVEVGLKMALQYWHNNGQKHKNKVVALSGAYHGDTFGAMAVGERNAFNAPFHELLFEVHHIPFPSDEAIQESIGKFTKLAQKGDVGAFIFEPLVQGAAGMQMYSPENLDKLLAIAKEYDVLCIADEVMTGFGRTGKNFAVEYVKLPPDIICVSKGITGGFLPLGVTACSEKIYDAFYADEMAKALLHGHSYTANPIACAAANAAIDLLLEKSCQEQIAMIGKNHIAFVNTIKEDPFVKEARSTGTILAVELDTKEDSSYFNKIRDDAYQFCMEKGVVLRPLGNILYFMPPYCITWEELELVYGVMQEAIQFLKEKYY